MTDNQTQALNRLLKKLSAVRATLIKDERQLLDEMVLNARIEVEQHSMATKPAERPEGAVYRPKEGKASEAPSETAVHGLDAKPAAKPEARPEETALHGMAAKPAAKPEARPEETALHGMAAKPAAKPEARPEETALHGMEVKPAAGPEARPVSNRPMFEIGLDELSESYRLS